MSAKKRQGSVNTLRLLSPNGQAGHLLRMLEQQQLLLQKIRGIIPEPVRSHCLHVRVDRQRLVVCTDSPVWKSRLHYLNRELLAEAIKLAPGVKTVSIKVIPHSPDSPSPSRKLKLSHTAANAVRDMANSTQDPGLRAALSRLGSHGPTDRD